ncbi:MAG: DMT family transporter [Hyphomonadaceae bacterium]
MAASGQEAVGAQSGPDSADWLLLGFTVLVWGTTFASLRIAAETIPPIWIIAGRLTVASALLAPLGIAVLLRRPKGTGASAQTVVGGRAIWSAAGWMSLVGIVFTALPYLAYANAARTADSSVLAICNGAAPIFTIVLAHLILPGERMTWARASGVGLGFIGLIVLMTPRLANGVDPRAVGLVLSILAASLYAAGNIATRQAPRIQPILSSFILVSSGAVAALLAALATTPFPEDVSRESLLALLWIGIGPTGLAMIAFVILVQRAGPVFTSFSTYLAPMVALAIGVAFLHERPGWEAPAALALILAGVWIGNRRARPAQALRIKV